jgi:hypothetical protein
VLPVLTTSTPISLMHCHTSQLARSRTTRDLIAENDRLKHELGLPFEMPHSTPVDNSMVIGRYTYCIDQFSNKIWWCVMDVYNTKRVLGGQSCCSSHGIATMGTDHFLICFKATANKDVLLALRNWENHWKRGQTELTLLRSCPSLLSQGRDLWPSQMEKRMKSKRAPETRSHVREMY